jgi:hypothetical protein
MKAKNAPAKPIGQKLFSPLHTREEPKVKRECANNVCCRNRLGHASGFIQISRQRLLAINVLARLRRRNHLLLVRIVRCANVNHLHIFTRKQGPPIRRRNLTAQFCCGLLRGLQPRRRHANYVYSVVPQPIVKHQVAVTHAMCAPHRAITEEGDADSHVLSCCDAVMLY